MYILEKKPMYKIAAELEIAIGTVYNYLKMYEIPTRPPGEAVRGLKWTKEQRENLSKIQKGRIISKETREKMSKAKKKGGIGHKKKRCDGYMAIYFPDHPKSTKEGYIMEHILVMESLIGRHLNDDEVVHHVNGKKDDNRKENLQLMNYREHARYHTSKRHAQRKGGMTY